MTRYRSTCRSLAAALLGLLLAAGRSRAMPLVVAGAQDTVAVAPGQAFTLDLVVRGPSPAFNAFDLDLRFDPSRLTNTALSPLSAQRGALMVSACTTNQPFHLFSSTPDSLVCTLVIMCNGVSVTGPGTIYRCRFTAGSTVGWTTVTFGAGTAFYLGGPTVEPVVRMPIVVKIGDPVLAAGEPRVRPATVELAAPTPNPGRHPGTLDVVFRLPAADRVAVTLVDVQGRAVAALPEGVHGAGEHHLALTLPRLAPGRYTLLLRTGTGEVRTRPWVVLR